MSDYLTARMQSDYTEAGYHPGLPGSTRAQRAFKPLPKRTSPKPWDMAAIEARNEGMRRSRSHLDASVPGAVNHMRQWGKQLAAPQIGQSIVETGDRATIQGVASKWGGRLMCQFRTQTLERLPDGRVVLQITRTA